MIALSTDDEALYTLGERMGITCLHRSMELAGDQATIDAAAREAVRQLEHTRGGTGRITAGDQTSGASCVSPLVSPLQAAERPVPPHGGADATSPIVILYANVPVRPGGADLIDRAVARLIETGCDSVQSYAPVGKYHPWWMTRIDVATGDVRPWEGDVLNHNIFRRQDLPPCYVPDGGVIVVTRRALFCEIPGVPDGPHAFFGKDRRAVINDEGAVIDIDSATDAAVAEAVLRA
jgi:CMP-N-acetylneuraminic acid synthetase